jgi:GNAT superfamily N-acetyltransferase
MKGIRAAQANDMNNILSVIGSYDFKWDKPIAKRYYEDYFSGNSAPLKGDRVYVLTLGKKAIGVIGYSLDRYETKNYWLGWFYVHKAHQGNKNGKQLLTFVEKKLKDKGVKKLFVDTSSYETYQGALGFYLANGFRIEAVIKDYYGQEEDQIILSKYI